MAALESLVGAIFDDNTRLYRLEGDGVLSELLVEAWYLTEGLNQAWQMQLSALSVNIKVNVRLLPGQAVHVITRLSDGSELRRSGVIMRARRVMGDGGFGRLRLTVQPWSALLAHTTRSQMWVDKTVVEVIEGVLARYPAQAAWRWADDVPEHLLQSPFNWMGGPADDAPRGLRHLTVQYRQSDLAFIERLLAEEGLNYRFEQDEGAPMGHRMVIFADSANEGSCPQDDSSQSPLGGEGIRHAMTAARVLAPLLLEACRTYPGVSNARRATRGAVAAFIDGTSARARSQPRNSTPLPM